MQNIDYENKPLEGVFALLYGDSGTGKTHMAATLGKLGYVLIVDIDRGSRTVQRAPDLKQYWGNIEICSFDKFADLDALYKLVSKNDPVEWTKVLGTPITRPFDWIVYDTWSELQWIMMQQLRSINNLGGKANEKIDFRQNIQLQHWGALTDLNKLAIESLKSCTHINQVFIMQQVAIQEELTGSIIKGPAIHGKLVQNLPAYFEIVIHTYTDMQGRWCATTLPKQGWIAKTRLGVGKDIQLPKAEDFFNEH